MWLLSEEAYSSIHTQKIPMKDTSHSFCRYNSYRVTIYWAVTWQLWSFFFFLSRMLMKPVSMIMTSVTSIVSKVINCLPSAQHSSFHSLIHILPSSPPLLSSPLSSLLSFLYPPHEPNENLDISREASALDPRACNTVWDVQVVSPWIHGLAWWRESAKNDTCQQEEGACQHLWPWRECQQDLAHLPDALRLVTKMPSLVVMSCFCTGSGGKWTL